MVGHLAFPLSFYCSLCIKHFCAYYVLTHFNHIKTTNQEYKNVANILWYFTFLSPNELKHWSLSSERRLLDRCLHLNPRFRVSTTIYLGGVCQTLWNMSWWVSEAHFCPMTWCWGELLRCCRKCLSKHCCFYWSFLWSGSTVDRRLVNKLSYGVKVWVSWRNVSL